MKRPQFGLRGMLLVVTLIAAGLGWRMAVVSDQRAGRRADLLVAKRELAELEETQAHLEDKLQRGNEPYPGETAYKIKITKKEIAVAKKKIAELSE
jgi:hypothetical protein